RVRRARRLAVWHRGRARRRQGARHDRARLPARRRPAQASARSLRSARSAWPAGSSGGPAGSSGGPAGSSGGPAGSSGGPAGSSGGPAGSSGRERMSLVHSVDHAIVLVRDLETATGTYRSLLGREPSWRGSHAALGTANALFRLRNCYLELLSPAGTAGIANLLAAWLDERGEGPPSFAFGTDDAQRCAEGLRKQGVAANEPSEAENRESRTAALRRWRHVMLPPSATRGLLVFAVQHLSPPEALPPAAFAAETLAAVSAVDHLVVQSDDLEAARALYGE